MKTTEELLAIVRKSVAGLHFKESPDTLYAPIQYEMGLGGKRIRPLLCLMGCNMFDESRIEEAVTAAMGIELFHNFTLLHDDVMDRSDMRRGKPCVHVKWNENTAILSGDGMQLVSYGYIQKVPDRCLRPCLELFTETALEIVEGQALDMMFETRNDVRPEEYMEMIRLKTAVLLACSLKMGAIIAGAGDEALRHLYGFGIHIGLAFQLMDDMLDVWGDTAVFGKPIGGDIMCNKKTFLLIRAYETAGGPDRQLLEKLMSDSSLERNAKVSQVTALYEKLRIREYCMSEMERLESLALSDLDALALPEERVAPLRTLAAEMMNRKV